MTMQTVRTPSRVSTTAARPAVKAYLVSDERADETCCNLSSLVQPHFFCGQLLTDQDLTSLKGWTQDKFRLNRYRDGWGVACGLAVHCDPQHSAYVIVKPGYAIDCCGDEIIVSKDTAVDLSEACRGVKDPCGDLTPKLPDEAVSENESISFLDLSTPAGEIRTVDLFIRYQEIQSDPKTALNRSVCREVSECGYSRIQESFAFALACERGLVLTDPMNVAAEAWQKDYVACSTVLEKFLEKFSATLNYTTGKAEKDRLVEWLNQHPLHHFCFVRDWLCDPEREGLTVAEMAQVLFWLIQDCRNTYLSRACFDCSSNWGVLLARIWLVISEQDGQRHCQVVYIDAYPPYRRPLSPPAWPAPAGQVNLGEFIWRRWPEACVQLAQKGVRVVGEEPWTLPDTPANLPNWLPYNLFFECGSEITVLTLNILGERRIVGFTQAGYGAMGAAGEKASAEPAREKEPAEDDLTQISGISAHRARNLRDHGITSYAALAATPNERLREMQLKAGDDAFEYWKEQARNKMKR